jgi:hypothetical protein
MKRIGVLALFAAVLSFASCSSSKVSSSTSSATTVGSSCGKVLSNLYSQFQSSGTLDLANSTVLSKVAELGTYYKSLKDNQTNLTFIKKFTSGLVSGSKGLVTSKNSSNVINNLLSITGLSNITSSTASATAASSNVVSGLTNLFKSIKQ